MTDVVLVEGTPTVTVVGLGPDDVEVLVGPGPVTTVTYDPGPPGPPGPQGAQGPQGPAGQDAVGAYTHTQSVPASAWVIDHGLGFHPGGVTVIDSAGAHVEGDITYPAPGTVHITFSGAFSGVAYLS